MIAFYSYRNVQVATFTLTLSTERRRQIVHLVFLSQAACGQRPSTTLPYHYGSKRRGLDGLVDELMPVDAYAKGVLVCASCGYPKWGDDSGPASA